ncbi:hypothetical protein ACHAXT_012418 [Thalassiosira profunda]
MKIAPMQASPKPTRRLAFQPAVTVHPVPCEMTQVEKSRSVYSPDELGAIAREVNSIHDACKKRMPNDPTCVARSILLEEPALRGFELSVCPIRRRNKALVQKALLKYHQNLRSKPRMTCEEKLLSLAKASAKLNAWATQVAIETARYDAIQASEGGHAIPILKPVDITPFPITTKRRRVTCEDDDTMSPAKKRRLRA